MLDMVSYRGPDDSGTFIDKNVGIGNRRLSIIDVEGGKQPIHNEEGDMWIVFNGEIYNHPQLKVDLESKGHRFYTDTDTEDILHLYEEYGKVCVKKLRGMFAFAIWDGEKLFIARDRLGIKPLYWTVHDDVFYFGSEIKQVLLSGIPRKIDRIAFNQYLGLRYVPGPRTMFENIQKLLPGRSISVDEKGIKLEKWWNFSLLKENSVSGGGMEESVFKLLDESVKMRLMSDVPLGAFLSGGIDSSLITALMSRHMEEPVKTFSIGFEIDSFDELDHAEIVSQHLETEHHTLKVKQDVIELLPRVIWHLDEPIADAAIMPTYIVSRMARKEVKVVLTGEGADELFAGYPRYSTLKGGYRTPPWLGKGAHSLISKLPEIRGKEFLKRHLTPNAEKIDSFSSNFSEKERAILSEEGVDLKELLYEHFRGGDLFREMIDFDVRVWLPDDLLMKVDKMSMANSLEARVPFLDHKLVELAAGIPRHLKLRDGGKYILKKIAKPLLPERTINRKKHGFSVPLEPWLRGRFREVAENVLRESSFLNRRMVERVLKENRGQRVFSLLSFEIWRKQYIESEDFMPPA